jgi:predicted lysophospholipase L1 biosynthesis ABC-type transport system permease subunit
VSVDNLGRARGLPRLLAAFLIVLGVAGLAHALAVTARRRRDDLWTLRAIGFRRRQLRALSGWQAVTITVVGLAIGVPVGVAAGRAVWREVAGRVGVVPDPSAAWSLIARSAAVTVVLLVAVGVVAGWIAARFVVARPVRHE